VPTAHRRAIVHFVVPRKISHKAIWGFFDSIGHSHRLRHTYNMSAIRLISDLQFDVAKLLIGVIQAPEPEPRIMRYELTDFEWIVIRPFLPNKPRGVPRVNDRRVLNGIF
jgi:hypothetical protein